MQYFIMPNLDKNPALMGELLAEMQDSNVPNSTVERDRTGASFIRMLARPEDLKVPRSVFLTSPL